jgi:hypothetical protein
VKLAEFPGYFREAIRVYRVPDTMPRTYAVAQVEALDGLAALRRLADPSFDPAFRVLLPSGPRGAPSAPFRGTSRLVFLAPDRVVLQCDLSSPGYVVLLDGFDPGWKASVDGTPAEVQRANVVFRAVAAPAGRHFVEMAYRPSGAAWGAAFSLLTLIAFAVLASRCRNPQSGRQSGDPRDTLTAPEAGS